MKLFHLILLSNFAIAANCSILRKSNYKLLKCMRDIYEHLNDSHGMYVFENVGLITDDIAKLAMKISISTTNLDTIKANLNLLRVATINTIAFKTVQKLDNYIHLVERTWGTIFGLKYLIAYLGHDDVNMVFKILSHLHIERVILIDKFNKLYTANPYVNSCGKDTSKQFLFNCGEANHTKIKMVYKRSVKQFNNCTFTAIGMYKPPYVINVTNPDNLGVEPQVLNEAGRIYNFTVIYIPSNHKGWGQKLPNGSYNRLLKDLFLRRTNMIFGNIRTNNTYLHDFTSCGVYLNSALNFYVPAAKISENWYALIRVFNKTTWTIIIVIVVLFDITTCCIANKARQPNRYQKLGDASLNICGVILGQSVIQPSCLICRYIFITWTLFSFIITNSYNAAFLTYIIAPSRENQIDSLEEIVDSNMSVGGLNFAKDYFKHSEQTHEFIRKIHERWVSCPLNQGCLNRTANQRDMATMDNEYYVRYYWNKYLDEKNSSKLHAIKSTVHYYSWILVNKGFPMQLAIASLIKQLNENGLLYKWLEDYLPYIQPKIATNFNPLNVSHLLLIFFIYIGGVVLATIAFLTEYFSNNSIPYAD